MGNDIVDEEIRLGINDYRAEMINAFAQYGISLDPEKMKNHMQQVTAVIWHIQKA